MRRDPGGLAWRQLPARALLDDASLQRDWDALNDGGAAIPVLTAAFLGAALATLATGDERLLLGARDGRPAAMLVVAPDGPLRWQTFQPSQLPLGALAVARGEDLAQLGASLLRGVLSPALVCSFTQLDPLAVGAQREHPCALHDEYIRTAWLDIRGEFDAYWAGRGKNLRQNMRKQRNRLAADGTAVAMRVWREAEQMAPALARYGELESRGWKAAGGTAIHADNAQGRFYRTLFEAHARRGRAVIYEYLFDSRTVAMNLCVHHAGTLVILKTTYDESVKPLSPAFMLHEDQLRAVYASGEFHRIEYYGRMMDWHSRWTECSRVLTHATVYRWPWLKRLAARRRRPAAAAAPSPSGAESVAS